MSERESVDPRYDPAFQRGYAGDPPPLRPRRAPVDPASVDPGPALSLAESAAVSARDAGADAPLREVRTGPVEPAPTAAPAAAPVVAPEPWRNPFLIAVAALGLLCLIVGGIWISRTRDFFEVGAQGSADFWLVMISLVGAPLLLTLGLAISAGVLFFLARGWQRRSLP